MWQRIQTVFLVIAILSLLISIFFPIWVFEESGEKLHQLYPLHYSVIEDNARVTQYFPYSLTAILTVASLTLAIIEIGKFKTRVVQMKLGALNSLFLVGVIFCAVYFSNQFANKFQGGQYGFGLYLPAVAVICNLLANRFIRRDERLVRDSERLR